MITIAFQYRHVYEATDLISVRSGLPTAILSIPIIPVNPYWVLDDRWLGTPSQLCGVIKAD
jgi:hypothetical protein